MHNSNEVIQRCPERRASPTSKFRFAEKHEIFEDEHMVFEDQLAVELYVNDVEVLTSTNGNRRHDQVNMGRVHSPGSAKN